MSWKRLALAALLALIAARASFLPIRVLVTWCYGRADPYDGQVGLAISMSSLYLALVCGAAIFGAVLILGRRPGS